MEVAEETNNIIYSKDPYVSTYDNILTDEECQHFIDISKESLKRSLVSYGKEGKISSGRTGFNTWIKHDHDEITKTIGERIAKIVKMPLERAESFQVIYYGVTQEYRPHYDSWEHNGSEKTLRCMKYGGARIKTALCYLNDVKKGGGTKITKLNIAVEAKKGRLLIFDNTIKETNIKHPLSEHAGLPVEEGEKYAFNLWFKECNSKMLYSEFNPEYYKKEESKIPLIESDEIHLPINETKNTILKMDNTEKIHSTKEIFKIESYLEEKDLTSLLLNSNFNDGVRRSSWIKNLLVSSLIERIEKTTGITSDFYENINIIEYKPHILHKNHYNAYDLSTDKGKKYTMKLGQRICSISLILSDNIEIDFPKLNLKNTYSKGDLLVYKNINAENLNRDDNLERTIINNGEENAYLANIYIREINSKGQKLVEFKEVEPKIIELENYMDTLDNVLQNFQDNKIHPNWRGYKSFKYNFKGDFNKFKNNIQTYKKIKDSLPNNSCLHIENLERSYKLNPKLPLEIVNNVLNKDLLELIQNYYRENISKNVWILGDRQSKRFKAHNEPMSRFMHYEILPLIEKIVGKVLKPTYTYLSAYVKGSDLPPHTDRSDCEYTVSFIVDKPKDCNWNIYVHKPQQPVKHKGRYKITPPLDECVPVDCDAGGLMIFQGTDHIHFREKLEGDYYNILLLHYCCV